MRLSAVETMISQTRLRSRRCLAVGLLYHMQEKPSSPEKHVLYKTHIMFPNSIETFPSDNSRHSKRYPAFDLNYIKRLPKIITQAYWNHLESKNILKNVMLQDFMTNRLMHIKQFTEAFQWDGQSLAPRANGGWEWGVGERKTIILHQTKTMCSVNKPAIRFGLRLSCIHRNKLGKRGQL